VEPSRTSSSGSTRSPTSGGKCKRNARGRDYEWDEILPTYLETLLWTEDLDEAVEKAFEGIDLEELDEAWKDFI